MWIRPALLSVCPVLFFSSPKKSVDCSLTIMPSGHIDVGKGFTMGHEFTGVITALGSDVKDFKVGEKVVSPFTVCCMRCYYCRVGLTCRCEKSRVYGSPALEGAQAEYVDVPMADTTLFNAPDDVDDETLILMAVRLSSPSPFCIFFKMNGLIFFDRTSFRRVTTPPRTRSSR